MEDARPAKAMAKSGACQEIAPSVTGKVELPARGIVDWFTRSAAAAARVGVMLRRIYAR